MKIGILGAVTMGRAVGAAAAAAGHDVRLGLRFPVSGFEPGSRADAVRKGDLVVLATPWEARFEALASSGPWDGKRVLDLTNPSTPAGLTRLVGHVTSGAEEIARAIPEARVVKAFSHVYAELLAAAPGFAGTEPAARRPKGGDFQTQRNPRCAHRHIQRV